MPLGGKCEAAPSDAQKNTINRVISDGGLFSTLAHRQLQPIQMKQFPFPGDETARTVSIL